MINKVNIFSSNLKLSQLLLKKYTESGVEVKIINDDETYKTTQENLLNSNYSVFILDQITSSNFNENSLQIRKYISIAKDSYKSLFVFPYTNPLEINEKINYWTNEILGQSAIMVGAVYLGEPIDKTGEILYSTVKNFLHSKSEFSNTTASLYPTDANWAVERLVKLTFSMKAYGVKTGIIGSEIKIPSLITNGLLEQSSTDLLVNADCTQLEICPIRVGLDLTKILKKVDLQSKSNTKPEKPPLSIPKVTNLTDTDNNPKSNFAFLLFKNLTTSIKSKIRPKAARKEMASPRSKLSAKKLIKKVVFYSLFCGILYLITPSIFYGVSYSLTKFAYSQFSSINPFFNRKIIVIGNFLAEKSFILSEKNKNITPIRNIYEIQSVKSKTLKEISNDLGLFNKTNLELLKILNKSLYPENEGERFRKLSANFDYLESSLGFLQADNNSLKFFDDESFLGKNKIEDTRVALKAVKKLSSYLPEILGKDRIKRYIVVVGDEGMLRGSGGKISEVGILEIAGEKVNNFTIYNTENIVGNLEGVVEPPSGFVEHFNSKDWNFKEANWYSDFSESAERMIWFIEKSLQLKTDGVLYLSNNGINKLLQSGYHKNEKGSEIKFVDADNDFAVQLTEFYGTLINSGNYSNNDLLSDIYRMLLTKQIMVYSTVPEIQSTFHDLKITGEVAGGEDCGPGCFVDIVGEAEIAKAKGGENVQREVSLTISFEEGIIKKRLTLFIKNLNNFDYEAVFRVFAPVDSGFAPITVVSNNNRQELDGFISAENGIKQNEIDLKVKAGETIGISYYWELNDSKSDKYIIKYLKQPGLSEYDITLIVNSKSKLTTNENGFSLTNDNQLVYNTKLSTDLILEIGRN